MNLAYKKINSSNVSKYIANKSYTVDPSIETKGITIYIGENTPIDKRNYFDANNDNRTSNNEYRRLVYNNIRHLFYKNYDNSSQLFLSSSRYENFEESTYYSGSFNTTLRRLGQVTGSSFAGVQGLYDVNGTLYDQQKYDFNPFSLGSGDLITVVSLDTQLYGSRLTPKSVDIQIQDFLIDEVETDLFIKDDGEGNLFDFGNETAYLDFIENGTVPELYIGNVLYSAGLIIITNQDYICIFGSPPTAVNNIYNYINTEQPQDFDVTQNDFSDCGGIDYSSIALSPLDGEDFPDVFINAENSIQIIQNQKSFIPGTYKVGYTINTNNGLTSNVGILTVNISSGPLQITNLNVGVSCNTTSSTDFSFSIQGGIPVYAWSLDGTNYTQLSGFYNIAVSTSSFFPNDTGTIYIKDYLDNEITQNFRTRYVEPNYTVTLLSASYCNPNNGSIIVNSSENFTYFISGSATELNTNTEYTIGAGNYDLIIEGGGNCGFNNNITINQVLPVSISSSINNATCFGGSNGSINITNINGGDAPYSTKITYPDLRVFNTSSVNFLQTGIYNVEVTDNRGCVFTSSISITAPNKLTVTSSISYDERCFPTVIINGNGGTGTYTYYIQTPTNTYVTTNASTELIYDSQDPFSMQIYALDQNGCPSDIITQSVEGREYIYSGSYCEQI